MYFSKIELDPAGVDLKIATSLYGDYLYREHKLLWEFFAGDPDQRRDFLFRRYDRGKIPRYFVVSERKPGRPALHWSVETKEYNPRLQRGERFAFALRVNPVITRRSSDGKQIRNDVVMETRHRFKAKGGELPTANEIVVEAGQKWMASRAHQYGFQVTDGDLLVEGYHRLEDTKDRTSHRIQLGMLDYTGVLQVENPDQMREALFRGIGRGKSFGCGLLLLRTI